MSLTKAKMNFIPDSKYREAFNAKVLEFAEKGLLQQLKHRWWVKNGGGKCPVSGNDKILQD